MKTPVFPYTVAFFVLGLIAPLSAQNLVSSHSQATVLASFSSGTYEVPAVEKAEGVPSEDQPVFTSQDSSTLDDKAGSTRDVDSVVDLDVLRNPSPYRKMAVSARSMPSETATDGLQTDLALISAVYRESGKTDASSDCSAIALAVEQRIKLDPAKVLEIVELEVGANTGCACEIVKTAIKTSEADASQVVAIVEAAIHAAPESMRIVSQCAIAAMPESIVGVQALLARLDPNAGETGYSSKSAKSGKDAKVVTIAAPALPNPLDRPYPPVMPPPPIIPPPVTDVNPCGPKF